MPFTLYISKMQAGPDLGCLGSSHLEKFDIKEDLSLYNSLSLNAGNPNFTSHTPKPMIWTNLQ